MRVTARAVALMAIVEDSISLSDTFGTPSRGNDVVSVPGHDAVFVELHIEQGPELKENGIDIGVGTVIAAPATYAFQVDGEASWFKAFRIVPTNIHRPSKSRKASKCWRGCSLSYPSYKSIVNKTCF